MMHVIRLRGPWELEVVARFVVREDGAYEAVKDDLPPGGRATMPADWSDTIGPDFYGRVRYVRTFNKPTGLDSGERVFLVVEAPRSEACVMWKKELLGFVHAGEPPGRFEITDRLEDHNRIEIFVDHPSLDCMRSKVGDPTKLPPGGLVGDVRLEIED